MTIIPLDSELGVNVQLVIIPYAFRLSLLIFYRKNEFNLPS